MKHRSLIISGTLLFVIAAYFWYRHTVSPKDIDPLLTVHTVKSEVFRDYIEKTGRMRAEKHQIIYSFATGDISDITFRYGDNIAKGTQLALINSDHNRALLSPIAGVVSHVYRDSPGPIMRGEPILEIANIDKLEMVVEVLTEEAGLLKVGMEAIISRNKHEVRGKVSSINQTAFKKISPLGVEEYRTEVILDPQNQEDFAESLNVGQNFEALCTIILVEHENVITVPLNALKKHDDLWYVDTLDAKNNVVEREVQVGLVGPDSAFIAQGLSAGERVVF